MPHVTRTGLRSSAKMLRESGQQVILLIPPTTTQSTSTPFDAVASNSGTDLNIATQKIVYGHVHWHDLGEIQYEAGGKAVKRKADIELDAGWLPYMSACVAVLMSDGSTLRKISINIGDTDAVYTLVVEGSVRGLPINA